jgi:hypothetical protein
VVTFLRRTQPRPAAQLSRVQELARDRAERLGPYAQAARENAALRLHQAREWSAPRLETAAHRVEDTVAPRVAGILSATAQKVEPESRPSASSRVRRIPRSVLVLGAGALGAVVAYGIYRIRQASQEAEWQDKLDRVREQAREAKEQVTAKVRSKSGDADADEEDDQPEAAGSDFNGRVRT